MRRGRQAFSIPGTLRFFTFQHGFPAISLLGTGPRGGEAVSLLFVLAVPAVDVCWRCVDGILSVTCSASLGGVLRLIGARTEVGRSPVDAAVAMLLHSRFLHLLLRRVEALIASLGFHRRSGHRMQQVALTVVQLGSLFTDGADAAVSGHSFGRSRR